METAQRTWQYMTADNGKCFKVESVRPDELRPGDRVFYHSHADGCVGILACPILDEPSNYNPDETVKYAYLLGNWGDWYEDVSPWKVRTDGYSFLRILETAEAA